jgi:hypothetical protein
VSAPAHAEGTARLHPRNRGFAWRAPAPPYRRITPEQARAWNEDGGFLLPRAFTHAEIVEVLAELDPVDVEVSAFLATRPGGKAFIAEQGNITFAPNLVLRSQALARFCAHPVFAGLCHDLVGPDARLYWEQAVYKKPEKPGTFPWHQDNGYRYIEPQQYLTCWVALTDATRENGCPWLAPGRHRRGTLEHWMTPAGWQCLREDPPDPLAVEAPAGSIVVFSSLTPHRTGPNRSGAVRKSYIVQFAPDGARAVDGETLVPQDDPARQFFVLRGGEPVAFE